MTPLFAIIILTLAATAAGVDYLRMYLRYKRVIRRRIRRS